MLFGLLKEKRFTLQITSFMFKVLISNFLLKENDNIKRYGKYLPKMFDNYL